MSRNVPHYRPFKVSHPKPVVHPQSVVVHTVHHPALKQVVSLPDKEAALTHEDISNLEKIFLKLEKKANNA